MTVGEPDARGYDREILRPAVPRSGRWRRSQGFWINSLPEPSISVLAVY